MNRVRNRRAAKYARHLSRMTGLNVPDELCEVVGKHCLAMRHSYKLPGELKCLATEAARLYGLSFRSVTGDIKEVAE